MPGEFPYDVFLSHSAKDKAVVRPLAERLRQDGLKVPSNFGFRICAAQHVGQCVRLGLGAVGGGHVWERQLALSRPAKPGAPLPSPARAGSSGCPCLFLIKFTNAPNG